MFRKYMIVTLAVFAFVAGSGCTSKKALNENADEIASDESIESADAIENNDDLAMDDSGADMGDELAPDEKLPDDPADGMVAENAEVSPDDIKEAPPADMPADGATDDSLSATNSDTPAADGEAAPDSMAASDTATPDDAMAPTDSGEAAPSSDVAMSDSSSEPAMDSGEAMAAPTPEPNYGEAPKVNLSLKKIASQPYRDGKILVNAVYLARPGDTVEDISQKVFASKDKVKELCRVNAHNCSRPIKVADKFYYNSPQRPDDDTTVKTFYEDAGIAPQIYTAKAGDNIRTVGEQLLGDSRSWMELWATNPVESKGDLDEGTELRYWPSSETAAPTQTLAQTDEVAPPAPTEPEALPPPAPPEDMAMAPPPPPPAGEVAETPAPAEDMAMAPPPPPPTEEMPPAPDQSAAATGTIEPPPPPPPPPVDMANADEGGMAVGPDQTMALAGGAVLLLAAAALFISIRKKRAKRQIDFNTSTQTQIDS